MSEENKQIATSREEHLSLLRKDIYALKEKINGISIEKINPYYASFDETVNILNRSLDNWKKKKSDFLDKLQQKIENSISPEKL